MLKFIRLMIVFLQKVVNASVQMTRGNYSLGFNVNNIFQRLLHADGTDIGAHPALLCHVNSLLLKLLFLNYWDFYFRKTCWFFF